MGRCFRRKWYVYLICLGIVAASVVSFCAVSHRSGDDIDRFIGHHQYNLVSWEFGNVFDKWLAKATSLFGYKSRPNSNAVADVKDYFELNMEIEKHDREISRLVSLGGDHEWHVNRRDELDQQRLALQNTVEETIEGQVSKVLSNEGLSWKIPFLQYDGYLFPPVDFRFDNPPSVLVVSPRHQIKLISTKLLTPNLPVGDITEVEKAVEASGSLSALVTGIGGIATYPSVIPASPSLRHTLSVVAHEWLHHYMIFHSLGRNYWSSSEMTSLNETAADIVGSYIGDKVYKMYYADEQYTSEDSQSVVVEVELTRQLFDFNHEMRKTRLMVDELLLDGKIEQAETYMDKRRLVFVENGFFLRELNQAFFAFNGTYADNPASVSPIGDQLRQVREESGSLKEFIETVSGISNYGQLLSQIKYN